MPSSIERGKIAQRGEAIAAAVLYDGNGAIRVAMLEDCTRAGSLGCNWPRSRCTGATPPPLIAAYRGANRYIFDYLADEVCPKPHQ